MPVNFSPRAQAAASSLHRKHLEWWKQVTRLALSGTQLDQLEEAELLLRLKFAYQDYCRWRWDEDSLLSSEWIDTVSPEDFLDWYLWATSYHGKWDAQVSSFVSSPEFQKRVHVAFEKLQQGAQEEFEYSLGLYS